MPAVLATLWWGWAGLALDARDEPGPEDYTPAGYLRGDLDEEGVATVQSFDAFPLLWLGPEFEGLRLTEAIVEGYQPSTDGAPSPPLTGQGNAMVTLIYGDCDPGGGSEPSCMVPLQVQVSLGGVPPIEYIEAQDDHREIIEIRGVPAQSDERGSTASGRAAT